MKHSKETLLKTLMMVLIIAACLFTGKALFSHEVPQASRQQEVGCIVLSN